MIEYGAFGPHSDTHPLGMCGSVQVSSYDNFFSGSPLPLQEIYDPKAPTAGGPLQYACCTLGRVPAVSSMIQMLTA
jgi:hypothetical protein